jgi:3'-phosphoadenosine 5'-phosphosulfate (PAPS) 3'-phosphatase
MMPGTNVTAATCYILPGTYREGVTIGNNGNRGYMVFAAEDRCDLHVASGSHRSHASGAFIREHLAAEEKTYGSSPRLLALLCALPIPVFA